MSPALRHELEALAARLVRRAWVTRAALVTDAGEVLALCTISASAREESPALDERGAGGGEPSEPPAVARIAVESVDEQPWVYVDLGTLRLMGRLSREARAGAVTTWLAAELRKLGVAIERESLAQD